VFSINDVVSESTLSHIPRIFAFRRYGHTLAGALLWRFSGVCRDAGGDDKAADGRRQVLRAIDRAYGGGRPLDPQAGRYPDS